MTGDQLGDHDALFHALVREHRAADDVADGPHVRLRRAALLVDLDEPALVERHLDVGTEQTGRNGPPPDGDDESVDGELLRCAARVVANLDGVAFDGGARHLGTEPNVELLLLEVPQRILRDLLVGHRQERVECLENHDLRPEPFPNRA